MIYLATVANGDREWSIEIPGVENVVVKDSVYVLYDKNNTVLFSSPVDSLVCLEVK